MIEEPTIDASMSPPRPLVRREEFVAFIPNGRGRIDLSELPLHRDHETLLAFARGNPNIAGFRILEKEVLHIRGRDYPSPMTEEDITLSRTFIGLSVVRVEDLLRSEPYALLKYDSLKRAGYTHAVMLDAGPLDNFPGLNVGDKVYNRYSGELLFEMTEEAKPVPQKPTRRKAAQAQMSPEPSVN